MSTHKLTDAEIESAWLAIIGKTTPVDRVHEFARAIEAAVLSRQAAGKAVAWIDPVDLEDLAEEGWCVVHAQRCDPCSEHNADVALYTAPPASTVTEATGPASFPITPPSEITDAWGRTDFDDYSPGIDIFHAGARSFGGLSGSSSWQALSGCLPYQLASKPPSKRKNKAALRFCARG